VVCIDWSRYTWLFYGETNSTGGRQVLKAQEEFNGEEKRILDLLGRGLSRHFPNPQRVGCPDSAVLRGIALHKVPLSEADRWLDHFSSCSPCFQEFTQFRKQAVDRRRIRIWLAAAAVFIFAIAGWFWVRSRPQVQTAAVVVLDLRGRATVRGENPPETGQPPLEVPRNARSLNLELPIGSNEGAYDVALLNPSGTEFFRTSAMAKLEDHIVVLRADVDLAGVSPGSYFLGLRQRGTEWMRFPIRVL
jgi:hypothetical protein